jgi:hypothetical protein
MADLLGHKAWNRTVKCKRVNCCNRPRWTKGAQRFREERQWMGDYEDEVAVQAGEDDRPIGYVERWPMAEAPSEPLRDDSDCQHGCNGDCLISGSEVCTFACHPYDDVEPWFRQRIEHLETVRFDATRELYQRKTALARLAADEMTRMTQDWSD